MSTPNVQVISKTKHNVAAVVSHHEIKNSSRKRSVWSDLPYRLSTICVGVPSLWMLWCNDTLRHVSFQVIHMLCCYEYIFHIATVHGSNVSGSKREMSLSSNPFLRRHRILFMAMSFSLVNVPPSFFFIALLLVLSLITIMILVPMQQQDSTSPSTVSSGAELSSYSLVLLRILIAWYQGLFFIMLPFRSWISVTTTIVGDRSTGDFLLAHRSISGFLPTISLLFTVWNCDTGALIFGRFFGRKYIANSTTNYVPLNTMRRWLYSVSPSKSVEGLCGGVVTGICTYAFLLPRFWHLIDNYRIPVGTTISPIFEHGERDQCENESIWTTLWIGFILSLSSILGDILESALKRLHQCKDSGRLLPGHGGIYDRFDSSLVAIVIYHFSVLSPLYGDNLHHCSVVTSRGY